MIVENSVMLQTPHSILSIGYTGRRFDDFLKLLREHGVTHLVDVRTAPYSRFHEAYNRIELENALKTTEIKYIFMGDLLGGRPDDRECYNEDGRVVYAKVAEKEFFQKGIHQLLRGAVTHQRVLCLMCSELRPEHCHRSKLIGEALKMLDVRIQHIDQSDSLADQDAIMARIDSGQMKLFDEASSSRKAYRRSPHE